MDFAALHALPAVAHVQFYHSACEDILPSEIHNLNPHIDDFLSVHELWHSVVRKPVGIPIETRSVSGDLLP